MSGVNDIRSKFLDYFASEGHEIVPSSPLVPRNDPTLLFTNAGMVQFKNVFTGAESRPYNRAVTSQKCVRAGGKHNDLENVGYTARHHTFFEMLGNFSFGDYFKEQAIELAWRLITKEFGLPADKLLATVYADDDEAFDLWKKIAGLPEHKIIRIPTDDNFWRMGDTGPCGPCSEIFYDHGEHIWGGPPGSPEEDGDRFIEIWNLVFMQYEQETADRRVDLPKPSIDTGMGLERIATILQGVHDNYDIDLFKALIRAAEDAIGAKAEGDAAPSFKVIADHLRATGFLMADGVMPSNEGRGYVLRRIMRRAMRHANMLGATKPVIHKLVPALVHEMGQAYPELVRAEQLIAETTEAEEQRFGRTLTRGLALLEEATVGLTAGASLPGETAFKLYDTFGFPYDLTEDALRPRGLTVDRAGFDEAMAGQRAEARKNWQGSGDATDERVWFGVRDRVGLTEFLGYDTLVADGSVGAIVVDGKEVDSLSGGEAALVFNQTPFYAEMGGQAADHGVATSGGARFVITDVVKAADGIFVHRGRLESGAIKLGDALTLKVDAERRDHIRANHSATHILHECLRRTLGDHVAQKGSLVAPDRLRFDFSHNAPISAEDIAAIETGANDRVRENDTVDTRVMALEEARQSGARALFGEKYGEEVRVVSMGRNRTEDGTPANTRFSVELCGGTHVARTGDIGLIALTEESAVSSGVRRIEALTGEAARAYLSGERARLRAVASALRVAPAEAAARVEALMDERRRMERELEDAKKKLALAGPGKADAAREVAGVSFVGRVVDGLPGKALKGLADEARQAAGSAVVAIVGTADGRASVVVTVSEDLTDRFDAVALVRAGSEALGGKGGGGRRDMAQAGGPDAEKADDAIAAIVAMMEQS